MQKRFSAAGKAFACAALALSCFAANAACVPFGELRLANAATIARDGKLYQGVANSQICAGDVVRTGAGGEAHILTGDGGWVGVGANSEAVMSQMNARDRDDDSFVISLTRGTIRAITGWITKMGNDGAGQVKTPSATIGVRGTDFTLIVDGDETHAVVNEGAIRASNASGGQAEIQAGATGKISPRAAALTSGLPPALARLRDSAFAHKALFDQHREHYAERIGERLRQAGVSPERAGQIILAAREHKAELFRQLAAARSRAAGSPIAEKAKEALEKRKAARDNAAEEVSAPAGNERDAKPRLRDRLFHRANPQ